MSQLQIYCSNSVSFSYPFKACQVAVRGDVLAANPLFKFLLFLFHPFRICRAYLGCSHRWCPSCKSPVQILFPFHAFRACRTYLACSPTWRLSCSSCFPNPPSPAAGSPPSLQPPFSPPPQPPPPPPLLPSPWGLMAMRCPLTPLQVGLPSGCCRSVVHRSFDQAYVSSLHEGICVSHFSECLWWLL